MSDIVERLRAHEYRLTEGVSTMQMGRPEITTKSDRRDLQHCLDDAANEIETLRAQRDKALEALRGYAECDGVVGKIARATLAEIEGE